MTVPGHCDNVLDRIVEDLNTHRFRSMDAAPLDPADFGPIATATPRPRMVEHRTAYSARTFRWRFAIYDEGASFDEAPLAEMFVTREALARMPRRVLLGDVDLGLRRQLADAGHLPA